MCLHLITTPIPPVPINDTTRYLLSSNDPGLGNAPSPWSRSRHPRIRCDPPEANSSGSVGDLPRTPDAARCRCYGNTVIRMYSPLNSVFENPKQLALADNMNVFVPLTT